MNINKENCKLITFQHKSVLNKLLANGEYYCNIESEYNKRFHICYSNLIKELKIKEKEIKAPIFCWYAVIDSNNDNLTVDNRTIDRALEMVPFSCDDYYIYELSVPKEQVSLQEFYSFVSMIYDEEEGNLSMVDEHFYKIFNISENEEVQATIKNIKLDWVVRVYDWTEEIIENSVHTNKKVKDLVYKKGCNSHEYKSKKI